MRTRFAPSPTGDLHIGGARTALFNFLLARRHGGEFLLRFEDTDLERSRGKYVESMKADLLWLGLEWDGEAIRQSSRLDRYLQVLRELENSGCVYPCFCPDDREGDGFRVYDGKCGVLSAAEAATRVGSGARYCWRFRMDGELAFKDVLRGEIRIPRDNAGDFVVVRSDGTPTYSFAVVVDDHDMEITHVVRGEEHISNTPKQEAIYRSLGWTSPSWAHIPMVLDEERHKLSKRTSSAPISVYRELGWLPTALTSYLATLSWHKAPSDRISALEEMANIFDIEDVALSSPVHDAERLRFFGKKSLESLGPDELVSRVSKLAPKPQGVPDGDWAELVMELSPQCACLGELSQSIEETMTIMGEAAQTDAEWVAELVERLAEIEDAGWRCERLSHELNDFRRESGLKGAEFFHALREMTTGRKNGPPLALIFSCVGKKEILSRLRRFDFQVK